MTMIVFLLITIIVIPDSSHNHNSVGAETWRKDETQSDVSNVIDLLRRSTCKPVCLFTIDNIQNIPQKAANPNFSGWAGKIIKHELQEKDLEVEARRIRGAENLLQNAGNGCRRFNCRKNVRTLAGIVKDLVQKARDVSQKSLQNIIRTMKVIKNSVLHPGNWDNEVKSCFAIAKEMKTTHEAFRSQIGVVINRVQREGAQEKELERVLVYKEKQRDKSVFDTLKSKLARAQILSKQKCKWSDLSLVKSDIEKTDTISRTLMTKYTSYTNDIASAANSVKRLKTLLEEIRSFWMHQERFISEKLLKEDELDKLLHDNEYRAVKTGLLWLAFGRISFSTFSEAKSAVVNPLVISNLPLFLEEKKSTISEANRLLESTKRLLIDLSSRGRNPKSTSCGGKVLSGVIKYPLVGKYSNRERCTWTIDTRGRPFVLKFRRFDLESHSSCGHDFVQVNSGSKWCGENKPTGLTSTTGKMTLVFHSDGSVVKSGFEAEILFINSDCGGTISSGIIKYPASGTYSNRKDCTWNINTCGRPFIVTFIRSSLESHSSCSFDYVRVNGGSKYCGNNKPSAVTSLSAHGNVQFHSDGSVVKSGFQTEIFVRGDMEYKIFTNAMKFVDAERTCEEWGGSLASVVSSIENDHLRYLLKQKMNVYGKERLGEAWIGYTDRSGEGNFRWLGIDTASPHYSNWQPGEPNNVNNGEDCTTLVEFHGDTRRDWHGRWNDHVCTRTFPAICEREK